MKQVTSPSNPLFKTLRGLHDKKGRTKEGAFILEGVRLVKDAADSGAVIRLFVASESFARGNRDFLSMCDDRKLVLMPDALFRKTGDTDTPQGIIAVAEIPQHNERDILSKARRIIALENLQDPGNAGTIVRSADACGFDAVFFSKDSVDPYNSKAVRATMGSLFHLPVIICEDLFKTMKILKSHGVGIVSAEPRDAVPCWEADLSDHIALVIGNEGNGISEHMLKLSDKKVMIPMSGGAESLNAAAAASILLYESMRQSRGRSQANCNMPKMADH